MPKGKLVMPQHLAEHIEIEPYRGVVNVMFADAMIASTRDALILREEGRAPAFYIPFSDIYFDFLTRSTTTTESATGDTATYWNVTAKGEAAKDIMWAYEAPPENMRALLAHGAFDPEKVSIEAAPADDPKEEEHRP
ncbi:DUF427 domain-containing protein [Mesorhizobium sp. J18]|uniref:DUF427 domain-containing protein n=1 Tax=Mesorhizobium sp. J18 TaxID=935263 RepID=UPI001FEF3C5E|nr:DUF427 domain-containing protein [Mesorhizobium sp. J18]